MAGVTLSGPGDTLGQLAPKLLAGVRSDDIQPRRAFLYEQEISRRSGRDLDPNIKAALSVHQRRRNRHLVQTGHRKHYHQSLARNPQEHFLHKSLNPSEAAKPLLLMNELKFLKNLIRRVDPDTILAEFHRSFAESIRPGSVKYKLTAAKYIAALSSNEAPSKTLVSLLEKLDGEAGTSNQCAGLGSFCERRVGLALSMLRDYGYIRDFKLFGEAALPLAANENKAKNETVDYKKGEEAMGIDAMVRVDSAGAYEYALLQIKAQANPGFKERANEASKAHLVLDRQELEQLMDLVPAVSEFCKPDPVNRGKFLLPIERNIFVVDVAKRKFQKTCYGDQDQDIVNFLLASFEYMQDSHIENLEAQRGKVDSRPRSKRLLVLDRPYEELTYPERIAALINANFLKPTNLKKTKQASRLILPG